MAAHRYWRARAPATFDVVRVLACTALDMRTSPGGSNVATGGTAIADGFYSGYPPSNAFDGNSATFWTTFTVTAPVSGHWIGYDFGAGNDKDIVEIVFTSRSDGFREDPSRLYVDYSDDGTTWINAWGAWAVSAWTANQSRTFALSDPVVAAWRVRAPTTGDPYFGTFAIAELEFRSAPGGSDLTTGKIAASAYDYPGYPASNAIDNNSATFWTTGNFPYPPAGGWWLGVDIADSATIVEVVLQVRPDTFREDPSALYLESTSDELTWAVRGYIASIPSWTAGETRTLSFAPSTGRRRQMAVCN